MRVAVLGAGVVGVTTAWYLTKLGHEVTLIERRSGPALETSFGNAGGVCPGFAGPWAAPGMPFKAFKWLFKSQAPLKWRPRADLAQWRWLAAFVKNCTPEAFARNKARMQRMAHYSKASLVALREETGITYDNASNGVLQVFATEEEMEGGRRSARVLSELGIPHRLVDGDGVREVEPGLARAHAPLVGGLHLLEDETGDCHLFCQSLTSLLRDAGCTMHFDTVARAFVRDGDRITHVDTSAGPIPADAFVVATGPYAPQLLRPLGIDVPVYPVKGYSMTCDISEDGAAPRSSVMDEHSKVMVTRLGSRLRAAGVAELAGFDARIPEGAKRALRSRVETLFPGAANYQQAQFWCGFRPMTPDGPARLGQAGCRNLYLNVGHGSNGWTQACGTARVVAYLVSGKTPEIEV
ncbi:D-amino acid dehydrogenase [Mesorhizobium sp. CAU 1741]|uniref:D-amino acid dehydrogenase n=1 Tax=Mesorhizobium sp. CAU 1741 TaxID=3140366 RepID=UPI00325AB073